MVAEMSLKRLAEPGCTVKLACVQPGLSADAQGCCLDRPAQAPWLRLQGCCRCACAGLPGTGAELGGIAGRPGLLLALARASPDTDSRVHIVTGRLEDQPPDVRMQGWGGRPQRWCWLQPAQGRREVRGRRSALGH